METPLLCQLLDYDGRKEEDVFALNFEIDIRDPETGKTETIELKVRLESRGAEGRGKAGADGRLGVACACGMDDVQAGPLAGELPLPAGRPTTPLPPRPQPGGSDIPVTAFNKDEYVSLYIYYYFYEHCCVSFDAFREGFSRVVHRSRCVAQEPRRPYGRGRSYGMASPCLGGMACCHHLPVPIPTMSNTAPCVLFGPRSLRLVPLVLRKQALFSRNRVPTCPL